MLFRLTPTARLPPPVPVPSFLRYKRYAVSHDTFPSNVPRYFTCSFTLRPATVAGICSPSLTFTMAQVLDRFTRRPEKYPKTPSQYITTRVGAPRAEKGKGGVCGLHVGGGRGDASWGADPPLRVSFPCAITIASGVHVKGGEQLLALAQRCALCAYRLQGGHWKWECAVRGRQGVAKGQLVRYGVLPITGVRGWGDRLEAHMDHVWLLMHSHAQAETRVHSGELGAVQVEGDGDNGDAC